MESLLSRVERVDGLKIIPKDHNTSFYLRHDSNVVYPFTKCKKLTTAPPSFLEPAQEVDRDRSDLLEIGPRLFGWRKPFFEWTTALPIVPAQLDSLEILCMWVLDCDAMFGIVVYVHVSEGVSKGSRSQVTCLATLIRC